jgi:hypothetical protein
MSKTPPELFRAGFEIAQSFSDIANHLIVLLLAEKIARQPFEIHLQVSGDVRQNIVQRSDSQEPMRRYCHVMLIPAAA